VAGEAAAEAALAELGEAWARARAEGRLVQALPLAAVDSGHLVRDRIAADEAEMAPLVASIREHGQRTPVEVTDLGQGRYGLISGWRRMQALQRLSDETGAARFATVLALLRRPADAGAAYVAMVEENEIRQGLSYYERARIAARAADLGVFETERQALQRLFATASRARRSKIGSFLTLYRRLDGALGFPAAIPERLGLALVAALEARPEAAAALVADLRETPAAAAQEELDRLAGFVRGRTGAKPARPAPRELRPGVRLGVSGSAARPVLTLAGPGVDAAFRARLEAWLAAGE
jgi:ParB/RepB/Spo0J family partition protein